MNYPPLSYAGTLRNSHQNLCAKNKSFWSCRQGPFVGCCSHDPCHGGLCHDLDEEVLSHMSLQALNRRDASTTTVTLTLISFADPPTGTSSFVTSIPATNYAARIVPDNALVTASPSTSPLTSADISPSIQSYPSLISTAVIPSANTSLQKYASWESKELLSTSRLLAAAVVNPLVATSKALSPSSVASKVPQSASSNLSSRFGVQPASSSKTPSASATIPVTTTPLPPPVAGGKKPKGQIIGLSIGIFAAILVMSFLLCGCLSRRRAAALGKAGSYSERHSRARKNSREGGGVDIIRTKATDVPTPLTPGGAKLEEQRGRMLRQPTELRVSKDHSIVNGIGGVPTISVPVPAARPALYASERPATNINWLGSGLVHPAYRAGGDRQLPYLAATRSDTDLPNLIRQSMLANSGRFYGGGDVVQELHNMDSRPATTQPIPKLSPTSRSVRTVSWTPGNDVIHVAGRDEPDLLPNNELDHSNVHSEDPMKPRFNDAKAKWAIVSSPSDSYSPSAGLGWNIGQAVSTARAIRSSGTENRGVEDESTAMSTENEITSPVEAGGLQRPTRRLTYKGFDDMLNGDGKLRKVGADDGKVIGNTES